MRKFIVFILFSLLILNSGSVSGQGDLYDVSLSINNIIVSECPNDPCDIFFEVNIPLRDDPKQPENVEDYIGITLDTNQSIDINFEITRIQDPINLKVVANNPEGLDQNIGEFEFSTQPKNNAIFLSTNGHVTINISISRVATNDDEALEGYETWEIAIASIILLIILFFILRFLKRKLVEIANR